MSTLFSLAGVHVALFSGGLVAHRACFLHLVSGGQSVMFLSLPEPLVHPLQVWLLYKACLRPYLDTYMASMCKSAAPYLLRASVDDATFGDLLAGLPRAGISVATEKEELVVWGRRKCSLLWQVRGSLGWLLKILSGYKYFMSVRSLGCRGTKRLCTRECSKSCGQPSRARCRFSFRCPKCPVVELQTHNLCCPLEASYSCAMLSWRRRWSICNDQLHPIRSWRNFWQYVFSHTVWQWF